MGRQQIAGFDEADRSDRIFGFGDRNLPREGLPGPRHRAFIPEVKKVAAGRNARNRYLPLAVGNGVVVRLHHHDDRTHFRMDVAEDIANSRTVELHPPGCARFVKSEVEPLALKERKHVMKERVEIGEIHRRADRNHEDVRFEALVLLRESKSGVNGVAFPSGPSGRVVRGAANGC